MSRFQLLTCPGDMPTDATPIIWQAPGEEGSLASGIGPFAAELGVVPDSAIDLLRIVVAALFADRTGR